MRVRLRGRLETYKELKKPVFPNEALIFNLNLADEINTYSSQIASYPTIVMGIDIIHASPAPSPTLQAWWESRPLQSSGWDSGQQTYRFKVLEKRLFQAWTASLSHICINRPKEPLDGLPNRQLSFRVCL